MMNTTTGTKRGSSLMLLIIGVQALVIGALWLAQPYLTSRMEVDKAELEKRLEEVEKRARERTEKEERERKEKKVSKEDVEKLKKEVHKKNERKIRERIDKMDEIRKELKDEKREKLELVKEQELEELLQDVTKQLQQDIAKLQEQAEDIDRHSNLDEASELHKDTDALKALADKLAENPNQDVSSLQEIAKEVGEVSKGLQDIQKEAERNPNKREEVGKQHQTQEYRDNLASVNQKLDEIQSGKYAEKQDFSDIDAMIADEGMQLDVDALLNMEVSELYDVAKNLEQEIAADYAAIRAAELANIQNKDFNKSLQDISQNKPERKEFDFSAMGAELDTLGDVGEYREELEGVAQEVQSMWQNAQNMQGQALGQNRLQQGQQGQQTQQQARAQMQAQQAINSAAQMQTGRSVMVDMSSQMRQSYQMGTSSGSAGEPLADQKQRDSQTQLRANGRIEKKQIQIDTNKVKAEAMPGRKFTEASARKGWLYLDTWYIIGPWMAEFKGGDIDWSKIHPPEYEIDLAKEYMGKDNKKLNWHFTQSSTLRTTPPDEQSNSTYYAYTEVHFEKDQDMLLAIASDDGAKVWVNDILVWQDNGLSAWNLDEGFRKVAFKKGFNKILIRIANGPVVCQYSLLLCPPDMR